MSAAFQTYDQALEFLYGRTNLERTADAMSVRRNLKLERMKLLLESIGDPQVTIPAVHIAGTKGKGSTAGMIAEVLSQAGYRVGLFTSPHLSRFEERMSVNGRKPCEEEFLQLSNRLIPHILDLEQRSSELAPTFFEIATAMAWLFFRENKVEVVALEVGLGGRLDSTNLCCPLVSIITNIGYDHTKILGNSLKQIAFEKAGIVKEGVPVISGVTESPAKEVIREAAQKRNAPLRELGKDFQFEQQLQQRPEDFSEKCEFQRTIKVELAEKKWKQIPIFLRGKHQAVNATLATVALSEISTKGFSVNLQNIRDGISAVRCPARVEVLSRNPEIILDSAHNVTSIEALIDTIENEFKPKNRILIFSASNDKNPSELLTKLHPHFQTVILTQYQNNPRAIAAENLAICYRNVAHAEGIVQEKPEDALKSALELSGENDLICITGSFFLAAELRKSIMEKHFSESLIQSKTSNS